MSNHSLCILHAVLMLVTVIAISGRGVQGINQLKSVAETCLTGNTVRLHCEEDTWIHIHSVRLLNQADNITTALCDSSQCDRPHIMSDMVSICTGLTNCTFQLTNKSCGYNINQTTPQTSLTANYECIPAKTASLFCSPTAPTDYMFSEQFPISNNNSNCQCHLTSTASVNITVLLSHCQGLVQLYSGNATYDICSASPAWNIPFGNRTFQSSSNAISNPYGRLWIKIQDPSSINLTCSHKTTTSMTESSTIAPSSTTTAIKVVPYQPEHKLTPKEVAFKNAGWLIGIAFASAVVIFFLAITLIYFRRRHIEKRQTRRQQQLSQRFEKFDNIPDTNDDQDMSPSGNTDSRSMPIKLTGQRRKYQADDETLQLKPQRGNQYESVALHAFNNQAFLEDLEMPNVQIQPRRVSVSDVPQSSTPPAMKVHFEDTIFEKGEWRRSEGAFQNKRPSVKKSNSPKSDFDWLNPNSD
ncbi:uncharacterized protein LOC106166712 [Lingula anatina]|uniref:Uncharacterized protein LOC106166712 n=1 Tax=Lingula anatina TaxID=7574 RepID=A0A1S3ITF8_LINAN|nr:uncharacterized protein LOC106166712 [Lingula anatina]|eukprot:XP_013400814.1 uncharacterized protein LOC106166712 [Lingula anatina]